jgi:NTP pyrophosphatase (non-canonical NTP hydrolase)
MMNKEKVTIAEAQQMVDQWIKTFGVRYFSELTNMAVLTEEVGELARIMARKYGDQSFKKSDKNMNWLMKWPMCFGFSFAWPTKPVLI